MKHDAIVEQGIPIYERVPIPDEVSFVPVHIPALEFD